jgi:hypothetical protein
MAVVVEVADRQRVRLGVDRVIQACRLEGPITVPSLCCVGRNSFWPLKPCGAQQIV